LICFNKSFIDFEEYTVFQAVKESTMLTKTQKLHLAQLVRDNKVLLFAPFSSTVTKNAKTRCWEKIQKTLQETGCDIMDVKTLRDVEWPNMRRFTQKKCQDSLRTGASGDTLSELDEVILDVIGRDSPNLKPVNVRDSDVIFSGDIESEIESSSSLLVSISEDSAPSDAIVVAYVDEKAAKEFGQNVFPPQRNLGSKKRNQQPVIDEELVELRKERTRLEIVKLQLEIAKLKRETNQ
jgi:hypothetical protein